MGFKLCPALEKAIILMPQFRTMTMLHDHRHLLEWGILKLYFVGCKRFRHSIIYVRDVRLQIF